MLQEPSSTAASTRSATNLSTRFNNSTTTGGGYMGMTRTLRTGGCRISKSGHTKQITEANIQRRDRFNSCCFPSKRSSVCIQHLEFGLNGWRVMPISFRSTRYCDKAGYSSFFTGVHRRGNLRRHRRQQHNDIHLPM
jgi:hypothetical protein